MTILHVTFLRSVIPDTQGFNTLVSSCTVQPDMTLVLSNLLEDLLDSNTEPIRDCNHCQMRLDYHLASCETNQWQVSCVQCVL